MGIILIFEAAYRPGFFRKLFKISSHRVNRMLYFAGGIILLTMGIFGKLPRLWG